MIPDWSGLGQGLAAVRDFSLAYVRFGSIATGRGKLQVQPCPQCPVSDGRPERDGLS
jgi:hypothetical protein